MALPARPGNFDALHALRPPHTEVGAQITLRQITSTARNLSDLSGSSAPDTDARAHGVAITLGSNQLEIYEMIAIAAVPQ